MNKFYFKNKVIISLFIAIIISSSSIVVPAVNNTKTYDITKSNNKIGILYKNNFNIKGFIEKINNNSKISNEDLYNEIDKYLKNRNLKIDFSYFNSLCNELKEKFGYELINDLFIFIYGSMKYINSNNLTLRELRNLLNDETAFLYNGIKSIIDTEQSSDNLSNYISEIFNSIRSFNCYNDPFETYWAKYSYAKCVWDGYLPAKGDSISNRNVAKNGLLGAGILKLWSGGNYYDWSENAAKYIIGVEEETGSAFFYLLNIIGITTIGALLVSGGFSYGWGYVSGDVGKLTVGGALAIIGLIVGLFLLYYDWIVLTYFLFGSNFYFEMMRYGNVDFIVHVVDQNNNDIKTPCNVVARSVDAYGKNESLCGKDDVNWSVNEFTYLLKKVGNNDGSMFSLHGSQESPEKWKKAVPPPGIWSFTVNAPGYSTGYLELNEEILPGEFYNLTIKINKIN